MKTRELRKASRFTIASARNGQTPEQLGQQLAELRRRFSIARHHRAVPSVACPLCWRSPEVVGIVRKRWYVCRGCRLTDDAPDDATPTEHLRPADAHDVTAGCLHAPGAFIDTTKPEPDAERVAWAAGRKRYHRPGCACLARCKAPTAGTVADAFKAALAPCRRCNPPRPEAWNAATPTVTGRLIDGGRVAVPCPYCGAIHMHGVPSDGGEVGTRASHCWREVPRGEYRIVLQDGGAE